MITKTCKYCKKEFDIPYKSWENQKFCSKKCADMARVGTPAWNKGMIGWKVGYWKGKHLTEEAKRKLSESHKGLLVGEKHPRWVTDRTQLKRYWTERDNPEYRRWRKKCLERDGYRCKICGLKYSKENKLTVHHILSWKNYPELRYNINNGITLCQKHHPRKRKEEQMLMPIFQNLVEAIV